MSVQVTGNVSAAEQQAYVDYLEKKYHRKLKSLEINADDEFADLHYEFEHVPFERIRRITGYLVGTMDQWNSAKTAEERDRVKHDISTGFEQL
ncbi:MAG: anaerobic ribonucleoside-triphosphate reductase [Anaerovoracaceae bacterium]|nr:anaerobic ribonucleoside-triphosphate reductase [Anaerovoracaceae bacterium]